MKLIDVRIDGFGVWSGLRLDEISPYLTVFYGPNEAGKTTLMEFVRSVLYGYTTTRRQRYLPPVRGGRAGGAMRVDSPHGRFHVQRFDDPHEGPPLGILDITAQDGAPQDDRLLNTLLTGVDEAIYNNIFACGLREIQELGSLTDTAAADLLYKLSTGLDRVSLVDVMRELNESRDKLLAADDAPGEVNTLIHRRDQLLSEIEPLRDTARQYGRLLAQRDGLEIDIGRIEREQLAVEHAYRLLEVSITVRDRWHHRAELDAQLKAILDQPQLASSAVEELNTINDRIAKRRRRLRMIQRERKTLRAEGSTIAVERTLWRQVPRVEAVLEQQVWVGKLEDDVKQLSAEHSVYQRELRVAVDHLAEKPGESQQGQNLAPENRAALLHAARTLSRASRRSRTAQEQLQHTRTHADSLSGEVQHVLAQRQERDIHKAIEKAGTTVANLRRRIQLDERIDQAKKQYQLVMGDNVGLLDQQLLPVWVLSALGIVFALGVTLILLGTFVPELSDAGWSLAPLGLGGSMLAFIVKQFLERAAAERFSETQRQITLMNSQVDELKEERDGIDALLPRNPAPTATRLAQAERELETLEELAGTDSRRISATSTLEAAGREAKEAEEALHAAKRRWKQTLAVAGLPETLDPNQLKHVGQRHDQRETLRREIDHRRDELEERQKELRQHGERVTLMLRELGIVPAATSVSDQFIQLRRTLEDLQERWTRREQIRRRLKSLQGHERKHSKFWKRDLLRRRRLLRKAGVVDETEFRLRAGQTDRLIELRLERDELTRQIGLALGQHINEEMVREQFEAVPPSQLERCSDDVSAKRHALAQELQKVLEHRGRLGEQLTQLAADRRLPHKQLELGMVEQQLQEAIERWQTYAVSGRLLDSIRKQFEVDRQPQTLREASLFLNRLTEGHYTRIWTPFDRDTLIVDDSEGQPLDIEKLSRGTREQVFLALRLALVAGFARRGITLPMVLDDVLVNFDAGRSHAAAETLRDFAAAGHQLIIFTCHEHIAELFLHLEVPAYRLPRNSEMGAHASRMYLAKPVTVAAIHAVPPPPPPPPFVPPAPPEVDDELPISDLEPIDEYVPEFDFHDDPEPLSVAPVATLPVSRLSETLYAIEQAEAVAAPVLVAEAPAPVEPPRRKRRRRVIRRKEMIRKQPRAPFAGTTWHDPVFDDNGIVIQPGESVPLYSHVEELLKAERITAETEEYYDNADNLGLGDAEDTEAA